MTKKRKTKKTKPSISVASVVLYFLLPVVGVIFLFLFLQAEIKFLYKDIYQKEKTIEILQNKLEAKLVDVQKLSAEDRIVEIAKMKLGMVRINNVVENIFVSRLKIEQVKKIVVSKYE
jgi:cell division protein FtsL